uniref:Uncharacterized protein n=1 Tax=Physcomitrium patens TaxID=3218 RepID=A0A2K1L471_PHYPA|nr:hypothetical protein PHYPA_003617 [Physcomitrium patens]
MLLSSNPNSNRDPSTAVVIVNSSKTPIPMHCSPTSPSQASQATPSASRNTSVLPPGSSIHSVLRTPISRALHSSSSLPPPSSCSSSRATVLPPHAVAAPHALLGVESTTIALVSFPASSCANGSASTPRLWNSSLKGPYSPKDPIHSEVATGLEGD